MVYRSTASLCIDWCKPELAPEQWEFTNHPMKQPFYQRYGVTWEDLADAFDLGEMVPYPRGATLADMPVSLSFADYDDYARYLARAKRGYRRNYSAMEEALQRAGTLCLPAPIIVAAGEEALLFAGYRRLCLAWNYSMVPYVWLVRLAGKIGKTT